MYPAQKTSLLENTWEKDYQAAISLLLHIMISRTAVEAEDSQ